MSQEALHCRFRKNIITLDKNVIRIEEKNSSGKADYTLPLKKQFPFLLHNNRRFRLYALTRWGGLLLALLMIAASIVWSPFFTMPVMLFGFGCFIASFLEKGRFTLHRKFAFWSLIDIESGEVNSFAAPPRLTDEQKLFLGALERKLRETSRFGEFLETFTCGWTPDAFDILNRLHDEGLVSQEEFAELKRERIEAIIKRKSEEE